MSDKDLNRISNWLMGLLSSRAQITPEELMDEAGDQYSPSDVTWAIWYLKSEGRLRLTRDDVIAAA